MKNNSDIKDTEGRKNIDKYKKEIDTQIQQAIDKTMKKYGFTKVGK